MNSTSSLVRFAGISLAMCPACIDYPDSSERVNDTVVYTFYDSATDFGAHRTFAISDDVTIFRADESGNVSREPLDPGSASTLVAQVTQQMESRGFVRVSREATPSLGLSLSVLSGEVTGYYYSYWSNYWGYYGSYYYVPYVYKYDYQTGTLAIEATDLQRADARRPAAPEGDAGPSVAAQLQIAWGSLIYGVASDTSAQNVQRAVEGIDRAFAQSPYLQAGSGAP
jgi:hypothetical protein